MPIAYAAVIGDQDQSLKREILIYITIGKTILLLKPERIDMMGFMSNCNSWPCKAQVCTPLEMDVVQWILGFQGDESVCFFYIL